jgi:hypothetical protein
MLLCTRLIVLLVAFEGVSAAKAECRDPQSRDKEIYTEQFSVSTSQGKGIAAVSYRVSSIAQACESGDAGGIDTRKCMFVNTSRVLKRTVKLTLPDSSVEDLASKSVSERVNAARTFNDNCNNHTAGGAAWEWAQYIDQSLGDVSTWKNEIDSDEIQVKKLISLFGTVSP